MPIFHPEVTHQITGNTSGTPTEVYHGSYLLAGGNNITLSQNGSTVTISGGAGGAAGSNTLGMSNLGNTAGTSGVVSGSAVRFLFAGGNNVTLSQSLDGVSGTLTISAFDQSLQSQVLSAGMSNIGNTAGDTGLVSRRLVLAGGDNITLSGSTNGSSMTITISGGAGGAAGSNTLGISNLGNTAGTSGVISGTALRYLFAGGNNVTLSQSINGSTATVTISAFTQTVQTQMTGLSAGMSTNGNTSGDTGIKSNRLVLIGGNNVTLSGSTNAESMSITISAFTQTVQTQMTGLSAGMSTMGNTSGNTGIKSHRLVLVGGDNITLSGSTNAESMTITISAPSPGGGAAPTLSLWLNQAHGNTSVSSLSNAALVLWPLAPVGDVFGGNMTPSTIFLNLTGSGPSSSHSQRLSIGFYTMVNSTQLSLLYSASTIWGSAANANMTQSFAGYRWLTFHSSQFSNSAGAATTPSFSQTQYWLALWMRSSNAWSFSLYGQNHFVNTSVRSGFMNAASNSATTQGWYPFNGNYSVSFSTAMPNSIGASDVNKTGATAVANFFPYLMFNNIGSNVV